MEAMPPGWYGDPWRQADSRYWDGTAWSEQTRSEPPDAPAAEVDSPPTKSRRVLWLTVAGAGVALVVAVGIWLALTWSSPSHTVKGLVVLYDTKYRLLKENVPCEGEDGYDDMTNGGSVTIRSGKGETLGTGDLKGGLVTASHGCGFVFEVPEVPDSDFYRIAVGHRGDIEFSRSDLAEQGWIASLTLGTH